MLIIAAAALTVQLDLGAIINRHKKTEPKATCNISTVSYKFVGEPGTEFRYDGGKYKVPARGWIELIAGKPAEYEYSGKKLPLDVWPRDEMGMRTVPLPRPNAPVAEAQVASVEGK